MLVFNNNVCMFVYKIKKGSKIAKNVVLLKHGEHENITNTGNMNTINENMYT